jgi:hypothetical protein
LCPGIQLTPSSWLVCLGLAKYDKSSIWTALSKRFNLDFLHFDRLFYSFFACILETFHRMQCDSWHLLFTLSYYEWRAVLIIYAIYETRALNGCLQNTGSPYLGPTSGYAIATIHADAGTFTRVSTSIRDRFLPILASNSTLIPEKLGEYLMLTRMNEIYTVKSKKIVPAEPMSHGRFKRR